MISCRLHLQSGWYVSIDPLYSLVVDSITLAFWLSIRVCSNYPVYTPMNWDFILVLFVNGTLGSWNFDIQLWCRMVEVTLRVFTSIPLLSYKAFASRPRKCYFLYLFYSTPKLFETNSGNPIHVQVKGAIKNGSLVNLDLLKPPGSEYGPNSVCFSSNHPPSAMYFILILTISSEKSP